MYPGTMAHITWYKILILIILYNGSTSSRGLAYMRGLRLTTGNDQSKP